MELGFEPLQQSVADLLRVREAAHKGHIRGSAPFPNFADVTSKGFVERLPNRTTRSDQQLVYSHSLEEFFRMCCRKCDRILNTGQREIEKDA